MAALIRSSRIGGRRERKLRRRHRRRAVRGCRDRAVAGPWRGSGCCASIRARYGSDTLSTHALMRGRLQLHRWGVLPARRAAGRRRTATTFHYGHESDAVPIRRRRHRCALRAEADGARRPVARSRQKAGVRYRFGCGGGPAPRPTARGAGRRTGRQAHERSHVEADLVVGADGRIPWSPTGRLAARSPAPRPVQCSTATGRRHVGRYPGSSARGQRRGHPDQRRRPACSRGCPVTDRSAKRCDRHRTSPIAGSPGRRDCPGRPSGAVWTGQARHGVPAGYLRAAGGVPAGRWSVTPGIDWTR